MYKKTASSASVAHHLFEKVELSKYFSLGNSSYLSKLVKSAVFDVLALFSKTKPGNSVIMVVTELSSKPTKASWSVKTMATAFANT